MRKPVSTTFLKVDETTSASHEWLKFDLASAAKQHRPDDVDDSDVIASMCGPKRAGSCREGPHLSTVRQLMHWATIHSLF